MKEEEKSKAKKQVERSTKATKSKKSEKTNVKKPAVKKQKEYLMEDTTEIDMYIASNVDLFKKSKDIKKKEVSKKEKEKAIEKEEANLEKKVVKVNRRAVVVLIISIVVLLLVLLGVIYLTKEKDGSDNLKSNFEELVKTYFEKNIKGNVINVSQQKVTLKTLKSMNYNTTIMKNASTGKECNLENTYGLVIIENPEETEKANIRYKIEVRLDCRE